MRALFQQLQEDRRPFSDGFPWKRKVTRKISGTGQVITEGPCHRGLEDIKGLSGEQSAWCNPGKVHRDFYQAGPGGSKVHTAGWRSFHSRGLGCHCGYRGSRDGLRLVKSLFFPLHIGTVCSLRRTIPVPAPALGIAQRVPFIHKSCNGVVPTYGSGYSDLLLPIITVRCLPCVFCPAVTGQGQGI